MEEIPDVQVRNLTIHQIPFWSIKPPSSLVVSPPVTTSIGFPIVDLPGCVEWHPDDKRAGNLLVEDPKGIKTLCPHGEYPSFNAMDYSPEELVYTTVAEPPAYQQPKAPPPTPPDSSLTKPAEKVECPGPNAPRIGDVAQSKEEKVSGFELSKDGKTCITLYESIGIAEQYLPAPQVVATTAAIATVATTSALLAKPLADLLLKVVKPAVKKVIGKIQKILGKEPKELSLRERILAQRSRNRAVMELRRAMRK